MRRRAKSWRRPLGITAGIAIGLLAIGWATAHADGKCCDRPHRAQHDLFDARRDGRPISRDQHGRGHGWLVLRLGDERFYWNRSVRLFVPRRWVDHRFRRRAPAGTVFVDPFSGERFRDLLRYRRHLEDTGRPPVLDIVRVRHRPHPRWERRNR
jgi:hypothetical protein